MNAHSLILALLASAACLSGAGCNAPGKPKLQSEAERPDQVLAFQTLYKQNCAACHGENGRNGAALSLANPVYLATAGLDNIQRTTSAGAPVTSMPPFGKTAGGMLTDPQIQIIAKGMIEIWGNPNALAGQPPVPYASSNPGDTTRGLAAYSIFCARCHGADGAGISTNKATRTGSIVDPAYLALISNQGLRSILIAGQPDQGMPDWRSDFAGPTARAMTDQEITDVVAWIASHRIATPGQPYQEHQ
jgi:mono/diheme cytochrome c family protein